MTHLLTVVIAAAASFAMGYLLCGIGTWIRVHRQETKIRALVNDIAVMRDLGDEVPAEWVQDQLESMLAGSEFR